MPRLSRAERRAQTRHCLLAAAVRVFARKGLQHASIDEVAEEAGYTKGAFYANFRSKDELFLAMLDERFARRLAEFDALAEAEGELEAQARRVGEDFVRYLRADPEWERLFFEFSAYAARDPEFRAELLRRYQGLRDALTRAFERYAVREGFRSPIPLDHVSTMVCAMANGFAHADMLEPEGGSEDLCGQALVIFLSGLRALGEPAPAPPA